MMRIPTIPFRRRRKRPEVPAAVEQTISVLSVYSDTPEEPWRYVWAFSAPVTATDLPIGLRVQFEGSWLEPVYVDVTGDPVTDLVVFYDAEELLVDCIWNIAATPAGIAEAAQIVVPETGIVVAV